MLHPMSRDMSVALKNNGYFGGAGDRHEALQCLVISFYKGTPQNLHRRRTEERYKDV